MQAKVYVIGSSGHAKVVIDAIEAEADYEVGGLIDDFKPAGETALGYPVIGKLEHIAKLVQQTESEKPVNLFIAVGDNYNRSLIADKIDAMALKVNYIHIQHPKASISKHAKIGPGSIIMANASVGPETQIGTHVIINHNASVDHECTLGHFSSVSPGAVLCGNVQLGEQSAIGAGATVIEKVVIGNNSVIGAGSVVIKAIKDNQLAIGSPADTVKTREPGEKYLK
ncbi:acetyltransferase [uncultured Shewanella sp.]|uniref:acetyltransferase n=1 Tax=uncultured Shewanella sp. TaxID=173975 RepID=UPI00260D714E|nr:acetyltransferase [uncultured Shewanella sp.]